MRSRCLAGAAALAGAMAVAGCGHSSGVHAQDGPTTPALTTPATAATPTPAATAIPGQAAILTQYRAFFAALTPLSKMNSSAARRAAVAKLAVDPELTQLVGGIAAARAQGQVLYGGFILRPQLLLVSGDTAKLTDCQDSSKHGRSVASTGKVVTFGRANDLAMATMKRGSDGAWRMARIDYAAVGSCNVAG